MGNEGSNLSGEAGQGDVRLDNDMKVRWRRVQSGNPLPGRDGHCACSCKGRVYVFGGVVEDVDEGHRESNDLLVFDPELESWKILSVVGDLPPPRSAASLVAVGDKLYLFGGLSQVQGWFDEVYMFDTETNTWTKLNLSGSGPSPRDKLATSVIDNHIYVYGGFGPVISSQEGLEEDAEVEGNEEENEESDSDLEETPETAKFGWFDDLFVLDTGTRSWSQPMHLNKGGPTPRAAHAMCAVEKNLVIFGGRDSVGRKNDLHVFNTESRKWLTNLSVIGLRPQPRSFHTACSINKWVIVIGGRGISNEHYNDVHILDTETWQWLQPLTEGDEPSPRGVHTATVLTDRLVVFGGSTDFDPETMQCQSYLGDTYVLNIEQLLRQKSTSEARGDAITIAEQYSSNSDVSANF